MSCLQNKVMDLDVHMSSLHVKTTFSRFVFKGIETTQFRNFIFSKSRIKMRKHLSFDDKQLIVQLHLRGFTHRLISNQLNCCMKTISTVITNWKRGRIVDRKTTERRPKLSAQKRFLVLAYFIKNPFNTYVQCIKDLKLSVCRSTIERVLKRNGIKNYVACPKPFLSMKNQFAMKFRDWTV